MGRVRLSLSSVTSGAFGLALAAERVMICLLAVTGAKLIVNVHRDANDLISDSIKLGLDEG